MRSRKRRILTRSRRNATRSRKRRNATRSRKRRNATRSRKRRNRSVKTLKEQTTIPPQTSVLVVTDIEPDDLAAIAMLGKFQKENAVDFTFWVGGRNDNESAKRLRLAKKFYELGSKTATAKWLKPYLDTGLQDAMMWGDPEGKDEKEEEFEEEDTHYDYLLLLAPAPPGLIGMIDDKTQFTEGIVAYGSFNFNHGAFRELLEALKSRKDVWKVNRSKLFLPYDTRTAEQAKTVLPNDHDKIIGKTTLDQYSIKWSRYRIKGFIIKVFSKNGDIKENENWSKWNKESLDNTSKGWRSWSEETLKTDLIPALLKVFPEGSGSKNEQLKTMNMDISQFCLADPVAVYVLEMLITHDKEKRDELLFEKTEDMVTTTNQASLREAIIKEIGEALRPER